MSHEQPLREPVDELRTSDDSQGAFAAERDSRPVTHGQTAQRSEMEARISDFDWSTSPIGPRDSWSPTLRTVVRLMLDSPQPSLLWWGPEYISLYNDTYVPVLGTKHPRALGQPCRECWSEIWPVIRPLIDTPYSGGSPTWIEDFVLELRRHDFLEECHFTVSYSAVRDDTVPGGIGGVLATVQEITEKVLAERRVVALRDLAARVGEAKTAHEACAIAAETLRAHARDLPFALFYLLDAGGRRAELAGAAGVAPGEAISPHTLDLGDDAGGFLTGERLEPQTLQVVEGLAERFDVIPRGPWSDPPHTGVVLAIPSSLSGELAGFLAVGLSPRSRLDDKYRAFLELLRMQVASAIANARAYEAERQRAEALAELDRAKTTFFSSISHEFRTPLTLMLGPTEDLLAGAQGPLEPAQRAQLELVRRSELRLQRLVNALLDFARIEAGRIEASYEPVDLAALTQDISSSFRSAIERAGLRFVVDCPPLGEPVFVDREMWERIVLNLLSNALKFTFDGAIEVSLRAQESAVELVVCDTGVGIRPEDLPYLFQRFHRVEGTRARTHEGSGIGLALAQELARLHGGTIQVKSRHGLGTSFSVTIPRGSEHLPGERISGVRAIAEAGRARTPFVEEALRWLPEDQPAVDGDGRSPADGDGRSLVSAEDWTRAPADLRRILVVDDNADMREYLRRILAERWLVETAGDGATALELATKRPPDLVLADVMMPTLDGFGLLHALRASPPTSAIPIVMLSARAGEESRVDALAAGADDYLVKPFSARELVARVAAHLRLAQARSREVRAEQAAVLALIARAPVPICVFHGEDLVYEIANQRYHELAGRSDLVGRRLVEVFPEASLQGVGERTFPEILRHAMRSGEPFSAAEVPVRLMRHGVERVGYYSVVWTPLGPPGVPAERLMGMSTDVTEQVLARRGAAEAERQIQETLSLRLDFLTGAAHELRTPLTTLGLQADGLLHILGQASWDDALAQRCLPRAEKVRAQADRLERLIEDIVDAVDLRRETVKLEPVPLDLADVARAVVERVQSEAKRGEIHLSAEAAAGSWDRRRLEQILTRLLSNAVKFGSGQSIEVEVRSAPTSARVVVQDRGIGIAFEDQERIFDRFVRVAPPTQFGGFGLGLWVVRELAEAMGGSVRVESQPQVGARFIVELPRGP